MQPVLETALDRLGRHMQDNEEEKKFFELLVKQPKVIYDWGIAVWVGPAGEEPTQENALGLNDEIFSNKMYMADKTSIPGWTSAMTAAAMLSIGIDVEIVISTLFDETWLNELRETVSENLKVETAGTLTQKVRKDAPQTAAK